MCDIAKGRVEALSFNFADFTQITKKQARKKRMLLFLMGILKSLHQRLIQMKLLRGFGRIHQKEIKILSKKVSWKVLKI